MGLGGGGQGIYIDFTALVSSDGPVPCTVTNLVQTTSHTMRRSLLMAGFFSSLFGLLGCGETPKPEYKVADVYADLRSKVLGLDPSETGLTESGPNEVIAVLVETGYAEAVATLVMVSDGTVSLYFSNGGGMIGCGEHDGPRSAASQFLSAVPQFLKNAEAASEFPLPRPDHTRFYFVTSNGVFTAEALEDDLGNNREPLSPLFHKAQEVISQIRSTDER